MLSFLLNARNWPAAPYPFKVTNVILHLFNGALLAVVLWKLGRTLAYPKANEDVQALHVPDGGQSAPDTRRVAIAALFGAGCWLVHPLLVSTTLYVVQRAAMLSATFILIAILGWMASRTKLIHGYSALALGGMAASAWLCTLLAVLCKANGALLPLMLLLIEWIVLTPRHPMRSPDSKKLMNLAVTIFLILPTIILVGYLIQMLPGAIRDTPNTRGWTVGQRLLTEPRVLTDYLRLLFVPHAYSSGLFNDAFPVSNGWLDPMSTLPCALFILALIGAGFALRKRHPAIALALLFYFAGQLMESGWVPLELYFEHRNYLPAMLLFWPIGLALGQQGPLRLMRTLTAFVVLALMGMLSTQRAALWGNAVQQARMWAAINPDSARAQTSAALYDLQNNHPELAAARLQTALPTHPDDVQISLNLITAECRLGAVNPATIQAARTALSNDRVGNGAAFHWFGDTLALLTKHACKGFDDHDLQSLLDAAWRNPHWRPYPGIRQDLYHLQGSLDLVRQQPQQALQDFDLALEQAPGPAIALRQAAALGTSNYPCLGLLQLDHFAALPKPPESGFSMSRIHAWVLQRQSYWDREIANLRQELANAASPSQCSAQ
ncbi:tetratricopeptide repeat protein [Dyella psychrodurans]|uniref:Tetratricopeptide repeat protein n=2 Tax=Dyella psychrodurans TaxID=1927960 RepID=A0A370XA52_9GAMM|nr:tetratricopeptide repeat protein [Dyella psychrodurans]